MIRYGKRDVKEAREAFKKMRVQGVEIALASTEQLAVEAVSSRSARHRLACVAELVARIKDANAARAMLAMIPLWERPVRPEPK